MTTVAVANTDSGLSGKTLNLLESDQTITGLKTYSRGAQAPFAVAVGSTKVANLDADTVDGLEGAAFLLLAGGTMVGDLKFTDATYDIGKTGATRPRDGFFSRNVTVGSLLTVTGGQVSFPATQAASSDVNTLDDYEEGSWTVAGNANMTFTAGSAVCRYIKIGKLVMVWGRLIINTVSGANAFTITLPFTSDARVSSSVTDPIIACAAVGIDVGPAGCNLQVTASSTSAVLNTIVDDAAQAGVTNTNCNVSDELYFSGSYIASA